MAKQSIGKKKLSLSLLIKIIKDTGQGFIDDSVTRLSGSLAYATLFSIIPFLSLLVTIGVALHIDLANQLYMQLKPSSCARRLYLYAVETDSRSRGSW